MRIIALTVTFGSLVTGAALVAQSNETAPDRFDMPSYQAPARSWRDIEDPIKRARCEEQISKARSDAGQPEIERKPADPENPLLLAARSSTSPSAAARRAAMRASPRSSANQPMLRTR